MSGRACCEGGAGGMCLGGFRDGVGGTVTQIGQFEQEIKRRIKDYYDQLAALENAFYNHEIADKDYVVEYEKIKAKIKLLE